MSSAPSLRQPYRGLALHVDQRPETWPSVEQAAAVLIVGDRTRSKARKLLRKFLGRSRLAALLQRLPDRWIVVASTAFGISAAGADSVSELLAIHRDILSIAHASRGPRHLEILHAIDPETRAQIIEDGKAYDLRLAPVGGMS